MRMPVLQELQPFIVHAAFSAPRWHQRAGWATQWEKNRDREINNLVMFLIISSFVNRNYFHSSVHEGVHAAIPEMLQDKDFCWQTPTYYVF